MDTGAWRISMEGTAEWAALVENQILIWYCELICLSALTESRGFRKEKEGANVTGKIT